MISLYRIQTPYITVTLAYNCKMKFKIDSHKTVDFLLNPVRIIIVLRLL